MMAKAYENIAYSLSFIASFMKSHLKTAKNGMGIINDGDMGEMLDKLADMINENLHNVSQKRISITTGDIAPKSVAPPEPSPEQPSGWNSTSTDGKNRQFESKTNKSKIRLNETQLRNVIAESVKKVLNEVYGGYFNPNERTPNGNGQIRRSVNPNLIPQNHTGADNMVGDNARRRDYMLSMHKCPTCGKSIQDAETGYNQPFCPYCGEDLRTSSELMLGKKRGWA